MIPGTSPSWLALAPACTPKSPATMCTASPQNVHINVCTPREKTPRATRNG